MAYTENTSAKFTLGDLDSSGTIAGSGSLYIKMGKKDAATGQGSCTFQGWGNVNLTGTLYNTGKVIANSFSDTSSQNDRDLNMVAFSAVADGGYNRLADAGWYGDQSWPADSAPRSPLPQVNLSKAGGLAATSTRSALVNSVAMNCNAVAGGTLPSLCLRPDRSGCWPLPIRRLSVSEFRRFPRLISAAASIDLTFRYDDAKAVDLAPGRIQSETLCPNEWLLAGNSLYGPIPPHISSRLRAEPRQQCLRSVNIHPRKSPGTPINDGNGRIRRFGHLCF